MFLGLGVLVASPWLAATAQAHALLVAPQPRDQQDGYKDPPRTPPGTGAPCGISRMVPSQPETSYTAGQPLHVTWKETINHPGCFVIDFANANDTNFQILGVKSHAGGSATLPRSWSLDVVLPSTPCTACTLRMRQLMLAADLTDSQCPPATIASGDTYYSCANVILKAGDGGVGDAATSDGGGKDASAGATGGRGGAAGQAGSGGRVGTGGQGTSGSGGAIATGGSSASGGSTVTGAGGSVVSGSGGASASGGAIGTGSGGKANASGGASASGGATASGGASGAGETGSSSGCACVVANANAPATGVSLILAMFMAGAFVVRRRRNSK